VGQEAVTFPGGPGTKSLSGLRRFPMPAKIKWTALSGGSASVTSKTRLINRRSSRCKGAVTF